MKEKSLDVQAALDNCCRLTMRSLLEDFKPVPSFCPSIDQVIQDEFMTRIKTRITAGRLRASDILKLKDWESSAVASYSCISGLQSVNLTFPVIVKNLLRWGIYEHFKRYPHEDRGKF